MISKIAGYNDSMRIIKQKDMHSFFKKVDEDNKKVKTDNRTEQTFDKNPQQNNARDFYIAEYYKSMLQRLRIAKQTTIEESKPD